MGGDLKDQPGRLMQLLDERGEALYALLLRATLREDVAEDLLQDLFLRLEGSTGFAGADNTYAYARTAAVRLAFDGGDRNGCAVLKVWQATR